MSFAHPFLFLRHGETDWNREGRCQGRLDVPLNALGREQADAAAEALATRRIDRIVASPLIRASDTARAVADRIGLEIAFDPELMEVHLGEHQGELHGEWTPEYWRGRYDPPGGETYAAFTERVWAAMARAVALGPHTLIVAHGGLWRAAREKVAITPAFRMPNAIPIAVTPGPEGWIADPLIALPDTIPGGSVFGDAA